jgi:hypothetical protein
MHYLNISDRVVKLFEKKRIKADISEEQRL